MFYFVFVSVFYFFVCFKIFESFYISLNTNINLFKEFFQSHFWIKIFCPANCKIQDGVLNIHVNFSYIVFEISRFENELSEIYFNDNVKKCRKKIYMIFIQYN